MWVVGMVEGVGMELTIRTALRAMLLHRDMRIKVV